MTRSRGDIYNLVARMDPKYKPEIIRINISSTFMQRTLCPECGEGPSFYYVVMKPFMWKDIKNLVMVSKISRKWVKRMNSSWYQNFDPRYFRKLGDFTFILEDKSFRPLIHRTRGSDKGGDRDNVVEFLSCDCGSSVWAFNDKSVKNRPEIANRKGRYRYPQKFER